MNDYITLDKKQYNTFESNNYSRIHKLGFQGDKCKTNDDCHNPFVCVNMNNNKTKNCGYWQPRGLEDIEKKEDIKNKYIQHEYLQTTNDDAILRDKTNTQKQNDITINLTERFSDNNTLIYPLKYTSKYISRSGKNYY